MLFPLTAMNECIFVLDDSNYNFFRSLVKVVNWSRMRFLTLGQCKISANEKFNAINNSS